jgi:hypothetical protein
MISRTHEKLKNLPLEPVKWLSFNQRHVMRGANKLTTP